MNSNQIQYHSVVDPLPPVVDPPAPIAGPNIQQFEEPVVNPPDPIVDPDFVHPEPVIPIVTMEKQRYQLRDLPKFSGEKG